MVVGEGRPFLAALVVLNEEHWPGFAVTLGVRPDQPAALHDPRVLKALTRRMAQQLGHFPGYAQIRRLHPDLVPWTVDNGLLTPTLKVRRNQVCEHYQDVIEALYADYTHP
jgi:long-chain acyl-CoA synthetase